MDARDEDGVARLQDAAPRPVHTEDIKKKNADQHLLGHSALGSWLQGWFSLCAAFGLSSRSRADDELATMPDKTEAWWWCVVA